MATIDANWVIDDFLDTSLCGLSSIIGHVAAVTY